MVLTVSRPPAAFAGVSWALFCACGPSIPPPVETGAPAPVSSSGVEPSPPPTDHDAGSLGAPVSSGTATSQCDGKSGANLATGGVATASDAGDQPNHGPAAAFDDHTGTKWSQTTNPKPWIAYEFPGSDARLVTQYAISPAPEGTVGTDPLSWKLEASNGPANTPDWTTLHVQEHHRFVHRQAMTWYSFANATSYRRYRLTVTENGGGAGVALAELQLFGPETPVFSVDDAVRGNGLHQFHYGPRWEGHGTGDAEFFPPKYGCSSSWSQIANESVSFAFMGSQVLLYGVRHPKHGIAAVSIDGGPETLVDFHGPDSGNVLLYKSSSLCPPARHVMRVRTTGDKNPQATGLHVSIDRVQVVP